MRLLVQPPNPLAQPFPVQNPVGASPHALACGGPVQRPAPLGCAWPLPPRRSAPPGCAGTSGVPELNKDETGPHCSVERELRVRTSLSSQSIRSSAQIHGTSIPSLHSLLSLEVWLSVALRRRIEGIEGLAGGRRPQRQRGEERHLGGEGGTTSGPEVVEQGREQGRYERSSWHRYERNTGHRYERSKDATRNEGIATRNKTNKNDSCPGVH